MSTFRTISGSEYQVDTDNKRIRRVSNSNGQAPTARQGDDWRTYADIGPIKVGKSVVIFWNPKTTPLLEGSPDNANPATITSEIAEIIEQ